VTAHDLGYAAGVLVTFGFLIGGVVWLLRRLRR
jgi:cbb3-type cytochrome oxidase subunit 3